MVSLLTLKGKVWSGYFLAFILLLVSYFLIFYTMHRSVQETNSVAHTFNVINRLEVLRGQVTQAETGVRGYVITKDVRFRAPYDEAIIRIPGIYQELKELFKENPTQQTRLDTLVKLID